MRLRRAQASLLSLLILGLTAGVARADDTLATAYGAILRGDYEAGQKVVAKLHDQGAPPEQVNRVEAWLKAFQQITDTRQELREETLQWNIDQSKKALAEAEEIASGKAEPELSDADRELAAARKTYLALSFAAQGANYTTDEKAYAAAPWLQELRTKALAAAESYQKKQSWTKAHSFYLLAERIFSEDEQIKKGRESAARFARLEVLYGKRDDLQRRIENVNKDMLTAAVTAINENYYKDPNFKDMADAGLQNLIALCHTTKLYNVAGSDAFDGIANPISREHFLGKLEEMRQKIHDADGYNHRDLLRTFNNVVAVNKTSVSLPEELLVVEFTEGALEKLDQFTSMIWPSEASDFDKMMIGNFFGVGIQLGLDETTRRLKVVTPLEDSPALEAGVQPDDLIIEVDGESTKDWTTDQAVREITGKADTVVNLTLYRPSTGQRLTYPLKRRAIQLKTVRGINRVDEGTDKWNYMLDRDAGIGYIRLTGFNPDSNEELHDALKQAKQQGMKGLILDLRYNPGGLLDVAVATVSEFLDKGEVVATKGRRENRQQLDVLGDSDYPELPLVVLVNEGSASASEILAGALQDHDRAAILGERTFGKGSVQKVLGLERGRLFGNNDRPLARLKLTTALYYLPKGRSPHKQEGSKEWGVDPDWKIELTPKEVTKVLERERRANIIHNEAKDAAKLDEKARQSEMASLTADEQVDDDGEPDLLSAEDIKLLRSDPHEAPDVDPQLETALLQLRVKLAGDLPWPRQLARRPEADDKP